MSTGQTYRPLLEGRIGRYIAVDVEKTPLVAVVADGQALPFVPESFDLAIATQVFEYFPDPHLAARQIHSALRPNGVLFASLASFAPRFVDPERWRFTREGISSLFATFARVEVVPEIGSLGGICRTANLVGSFLVRYNSARVLLQSQGLVPSADIQYVQWAIVEVFNPVAENDAPGTQDEVAGLGERRK